MAINKAKTSLGMKIVLIVVIIAFVGAFVPLIPGFFQQQKSFNQPQQAQGATVSDINAKYGPQAQAIQSLVSSDPTSYTALVNLGNTYLDWAGELQQVSVTTTSAAGADTPLWASAKDAYVKALKVKKGDAGVEGDYAIALYNTGDVKGAVKVAEGVVAKDPTFGPMWYNLGIFYRNTGDNAKALQAYQQYLKVEPNGQMASQAKQSVAELSAPK